MAAKPQVPSMVAVHVVSVTARTSRRSRSEAAEHELKMRRVILGNYIDDSRGELK